MRLCTFENASFVGLFYFVVLDFFFSLKINFSQSEFHGFAASKPKAQEFTFLKEVFLLLPPPQVILSIENIAVRILLVCILNK